GLGCPGDPSPGKDVPARPARRHHVGAQPAADRLHPCSPAGTSCCEMLSSRPPAIQHATSEEPPYETNGSAMPLVGTSARTTLTLIAAWTTSIAVAPAASRAALASGARRAALSPPHAPPATQAPPP